MSPSPQLAPAGSSTYSSNTMHVGDGTWDTERNTFLLPNLVGLNFATMRYNGEAHSFPIRAASTDLHRNGKPLSRDAPIPEPHPRTRCHSCHCFPLHRTYCDSDPTIPPKGLSLGAKSTHRATNLDGTPHNGGVCSTILCSGTQEELNESPSWHRIGYLRSGSCAVHRWLVGAQEGKGQEKVIHSIESHGKLASNRWTEEHADSFSFTIGLDAPSRYLVLHKYPLG